MNKKGFTLIELLAVIVILAIIALIATPIILGIINDAKSSAKKRSAELIYSGVEYAYVSAMYGSTDGTNVGSPSLTDIKKYLKVENVKDTNIVESTDKLTITADDGTYCEVSKDLEVICGPSSDKIGESDRYFKKDVNTGLDATATTTGN